MWVPKARQARGVMFPRENFYIRNIGDTWSPRLSGFETKKGVWPNPLNPPPPPCSPQICHSTTHNRGFLNEAPNQCPNHTLGCQLKKSVVQHDGIGVRQHTDSSPYCFTVCHHADQLLVEYPVFTIHVPHPSPKSYNHGQECWDNTNFPPPPNQCWNISCTQYITATYSHQHWFGGKGGIVATHNVNHSLEIKQ